MINLIYQISYYSLITQSLYNNSSIFTHLISKRFLISTRYLLSRENTSNKGISFILEIQITSRDISSPTDAKELKFHNLKI